MDHFGLRFGIPALQIEEALQGKVGATLSKAQKSCREKGVPGTNMFVNRTVEEMERERQAREEERKDAEEECPMALAVGPKKVAVSNVSPILGRIFWVNVSSAPWLNFRQVYCKCKQDYIYPLPFQLT